MKRFAIMEKEQTVKNEIRDIVIAVTVIALIFSYPNFSQFTMYLLAVIIAFLFHELAHRFVARKFGVVAFFKLWPEGLLFGMMFMFLGLKFVAPGAVVIYPYAFGRWGHRVVHLTQTEIGLVSFAGIASNLFFAAFFKLFIGDLFTFLSFVNAWLAFFNLLPIPPLDGSKIYRWKPWFWLVLISTAALLVWF